MQSHTRKQTFNIWMVFFAIKRKLNSLKKASCLYVVRQRQGFTGFT